MKRTYAPGSDCWISRGTATLYKGRVLFDFTLPDCPMKFYVIKLADPEADTMEIRTAYQMSDKEGALLPYTRVAVKQRTNTLVIVQDQVEELSA